MKTKRTVREEVEWVAIAIDEHGDAIESDLFDSYEDASRHAIEMIQSRPSRGIRASVVERITRTVEGEELVEYPETFAVFPGCASAIEAGGWKSDLPYVSRISRETPDAKTCSVRAYEVLRFRNRTTVEVRAMKATRIPGKWETYSWSSRGGIRREPKLDEQVWIHEVDVEEDHFDIRYRDGAWYFAGDSEPVVWTRDPVSRHAEF